MIWQGWLISRLLRQTSDLLDLGDVRKILQPASCAFGSLESVETEDLQLVIVHSHHDGEPRDCRVLADPGYFSQEVQGPLPWNAA